MKILKRIRANILLFLSYLAHIILGVLVVFIPSPAYVEESNHTLTYVWAGFLILGGLGCIFSLLTDKWFYKLGGLCLLITAIFSYALVLLFRGTATIPYSGIIILSTSLLLGSKLYELIRLLLAARPKE